jgi:hypothetical protein
MLLLGDVLLFGGMLLFGGGRGALEEKEGGREGST